MCFFKKRKQKKLEEQRKLEEAKKAEAANSIKDEKSGPKVYHLNKRAEDDKWTIKFEKGEKVIKLFDTKKEAVAYAKQLAKNQDARIVYHSSRGDNKGKIIKSW